MPSSSSSSRIVVPRRMPCRRICPQFLALFLTLSALRAAQPPHVENVRKVKSTFLWSIDSPARSVRSFLFGTIHVPYNKVWQYVSARVKEAFGAAEAIVFELELQNSDTVLRLAKCKQLERDGNLRHLLPPDVFARIRAFMHRLRQRMFRWSLRANGNDRQKARQNVRRLFPSLGGFYDWARRKPTWLLFLLLQMGGDDEQHHHWSEQFSEQQQRVPMLDLYLAQMALGQGKQLLSVESVEEQCDPLESVQTGQLVFAINYTLAYLEWAERRQTDGGREKEQNGGLEMNHNNGEKKQSVVNASSQTPSALERLVQLYNCGTMGDGMEEIVFGARRFAQRGFSSTPEADQRARHVDNLLAEDILLRRNERMARRADLLLRSHPTAVLFFALGAGHLLGDQSIQTHLRQLGYWLAPVGEQHKIAAGAAADPWDNAAAAVPSGDDVVQFLDLSAGGDRKHLRGRHSEMPQQQQRRRIALQIRQLSSPEGKQNGAKTARTAAFVGPLQQIICLLALFALLRPLLFALHPPSSPFCCC